MQDAGFADIAIRRRPGLELACVGRKTAHHDQTHMGSLLDAMAL